VHPHREVPLATPDDELHVLAVRQGRFDRRRARKVESGQFLERVEGHHDVRVGDLQRGPGASDPRADQ